MARHSGLGRGLGALIPDTDVPDTALRDLPLDRITANDFQPRTEFDDEALEALAASIAEVGVLQPILVRPSGEGFELIAGERRWRAARIAGLVTVPAIVREVDDRHSLAQALVENVQREDLSAIEEAVAYQQLIDDFALTPDEVATRMGKSRPAVSNTLRLLQLPIDIQTLVRGGSLSAGHARALLALEDADAQRAMVERVGREHLSVRALEDAIKANKPSRPRREPSSSTKSAAHLEIESLLGEQLATRVNVQSNTQGRGSVTIHFSGDDDLTRIVSLLGGEPGV